MNTLNPSRKLAAHTHASHFIALKRYTFLSVLGLIIAIAGSSPASDYTTTTVEFPGSSETIVTGISDSNVIGNCDYGGFIYDGSTFKTLDDPALSAMKLTGISGGTIVGYYDGVDTNGAVVYRSFIYNGSTFSTLDVPGALQTVARGISGSNVFGWFEGSAYAVHGFIYNGSTFTTLDYPGSTDTSILGISGGIVVGIHDSLHPFTYNGSTFTTLDFPDWSVLPEATITGISGSTVVGYYQPGPGFEVAGFVYDGSAVTELGGAEITEIMGVSGNTVFGSSISVEYNEELEDYEGYGPGFVAQLEVPAPRISLTASNTVVVSWPYPSTGWNLQQNSDLTTTNWVTPSEAVAYNGTNDFINVGRPPGNLFFRLSHP